LEKRSGGFWSKAAFEGLELYDGKLSRTVLSVKRGYKAHDLPCGEIPRHIQRQKSSSGIKK